MNDERHHVGAWGEPHRSSGSGLVRSAVAILIVVNLALIAYAQVERKVGREPERLADQLRPSAIRIVTPREADTLDVPAAHASPAPAEAPAPGAVKERTGPPGDAPPGPAMQGAAGSTGAAVGAQAGPRLACVEWGPFTDAERARAEADLGALSLAAAPMRRPIQVDSAWWVNAGSLAARAAAERKADEWHAKLVDDLSVVDYQGSSFTVSLGVYRTYAAAAARAHALTARGIDGLRIEPWSQPITLTMLVVREPVNGLGGQFESLKARYAGTEAKPVACPEPP